MTDNKKSQLQNKIKALHEKYCQSLPDKYREIEQSWLLFHKQPENEHYYNTFYRLVHTLKGTAATFGFTAQAEDCFSIQEVLLQIENNKMITNTEDMTRIQHCLAQLKNNIQQPAKYIPE